MMVVSVSVRMRQRMSVCMIMRVSMTVRMGVWVSYTRMSSMFRVFRISLVFRRLLLGQDSHGEFVNPTATSVKE